MTFCMPNYLKKDQKCKDEWENILTIWNIISQGRNEEMCSRVKSSEKLLPRKNYIAPNEVWQLTVDLQYWKSGMNMQFVTGIFRKMLIFIFRVNEFYVAQYFSIFWAMCTDTCHYEGAILIKNLHTYPSAGKISRRWRKYLAPCRHLYF